MSLWKFGIRLQMCNESRDDEPVPVSMNPDRRKEAHEYLTSEVEEMKQVISSLENEVMQSNIIPRTSPARCSLLRKIAVAEFKQETNCLVTTVSLIPAEEKEVDTEISDGCFSQDSDAFEEIAQDGENVKIVFAQWFCEPLS